MIYREIDLVEFLIDVHLGKFGVFRVDDAR
jgi:hypothetical protein